MHLNDTMYERLIENLNSSAEIMSSHLFSSQTDLDEFQARFHSFVRKYTNWKTVWFHTSTSERTVYLYIHPYRFKIRPKYISDVKLSISCDCVSENTKETIESEPISFETTLLRDIYNFIENIVNPDNPEMLSTKITERSDKIMIDYINEYTCDGIYGIVNLNETVKQLQARHDKELKITRQIHNIQPMVFSTNL